MRGGGNPHSSAPLPAARSEPFLPLRDPALLLQVSSGLRLSLDIIAFSLIVAGVLMLSDAVHNRAKHTRVDVGMRVLVAIIMIGVGFLAAAA